MPDPHPSTTPSAAMDVLLPFGAPIGAAPARYAGTWNAADGGIAFAPDERGYPVISVDTESGPAWLVGETYGSPDAAAVARAIVGDPRSVAEANGHWLLIFHETPADRWHVWTDRFGTLHAYHCWNGQQGAVATYFAPVAALASRKKLDWPAITGFFGFGFFPADRTYYDDVRILRPATHSVFDREGRLLSTDSYWSWPARADASRSYEDTLAAFGTAFDASMADVAHGCRLAVPISGGLDSRSTVAALPDQAEVWAYSYGYWSRSPETTIARRIAKARHLPFEAFTTPLYLFENLPLVMDSVEGFQDVTQCRQAAIADDVRAHADRLVAAHWGDVWLDDMGLSGPECASATPAQVEAHALPKVRKRGREWLLEHLCQPMVGSERTDEMLGSFVHDQVQTLGHVEEPDRRIKAFKTLQWSFRWTLASIRMFLPAALPRLPFYDTRVADALCAVPPAYVAGRHMQIDYIKRKAPDLARITWQETDRNLYASGRSDPLALPRRAVRKGWRILTGQHTRERNWEVQFLSPEGRAGLNQWLTRKGLRLHEFVEPAAIAELVGCMYAHPTASNGYTVSMLLTFSAWLEQQA